MFFKDFLASVKAYGKAFELVSKLNLWNFFLVPALIGLVIGIAIIVSAYYLATPLSIKINNAWPFSFWEETILSISFFLAVVLILLVGMLLFKHVVMALSAPFMTPLSERVEIHLTGKEIDKTDTPKEFIAALIRGIRVNVRNLFMELLLTLLFFILSLIPLLNLVTPVAILYVQCYYAGYGNMDYTMERYFNYANTKTFVRKNKGVAVGNGFVFNLLLLVPVIGITLALPLSTIAATVTTVTKLTGNKIV